MQRRSFLATRPPAGDTPLGAAVHPLAGRGGDCFACAGDPKVGNLAGWAACRRGSNTRIIQCA